MVKFKFEQIINYIDTVENRSIDLINFYTDFYKNLSYEQFDAIRKYVSGANYLIINHILRYHEMPKIVKTYSYETFRNTNLTFDELFYSMMYTVIPSIYKTFNEAPLYDKDIVLYRGIETDLYKDAKIGEKIRLNGFISTSYGIINPYNYTLEQNPIYMAIQVPARSAKMLYAPNLADSIDQNILSGNTFWDERQIILMDGTIVSYEGYEYHKLYNLTVHKMKIAN